ncbi:unnamed protein product, partial [Durusdinium trenchii]
MDGATAVEAAVQLQALRGDVSTLVAEVGLLQGVATTRAEVTADERRAVLDEVAALRGQMSTVLHTLALALQDQPGKTESELYAAVAGLSKLCETTLRHCQETAGAQVAVAAKLAELQEETSVVAAALHRLRGIFQGDVENAMRQMVRDVSAVHQEGCNVPVSNQPQASVPQGVPSRTPEALVRPQKPRPPPEEVTLLRRMLREHRQAQLDSSPRSTGTPRRQEATQAWPSILQRRSLQRPMYPMWRPSRRPSPQWRDVGMPNVQQPFLADALQQGWACRSASPPQQLHQQLGHLQQVEEQLHKLKEPTRRRDVHQVYQELLQLQEIQRSLQHLGLEEEHVVTSEQSPAASCGGILFAQTGERGNNSASFTPEQLVEMEKLTGTPSVPFPRFGAGEGPQWGDLQLRLLQQLEMLQQKQPTQSTKEVQTDPAEAEDGPESESQAEFKKRQHDSLAERLFQSGFIPELNASSGSMSTVLPTGRHESEDTEQRESEPASPELSQLSRPSALAAGPKAQAQQKAERSSDGNIVQDSKLRSSHGTQESDSLSFDRFEVCQQSFVLSPSGHVRTASSPASGGLAEKEEAQYSIFCGMAA